MSYVGKIVTWESPEQIKKEDLENALIDNDFADYVPSLSVKTAFGRAVKNRSYKKLVRPIRPGDGTSGYQYTSEDKVNAGKDLEYKTFSKVTIDPKTKEIKADLETLKMDLENEFKETSSNYTKLDINKTIGRILDKEIGTFPIKKRAGFYFVPSNKDNNLVVSKLQSLINSIHGEFLELIVPENSEGLKLAKNSITNTLDSLVNELKEAIEGYDASTSPITLSHMTTKLSKARLKAEAYSMLLQDSKELIDNRISELADVVTEKIRTLV